MMENDKDIDLATSEWLKKLPFEEPSDAFSRNVMNSVYALETKKVNDNISYWWFLLVIPVLIAAGWYLSTVPSFGNRISEIWGTAQANYTALNTEVGSIFIYLKTMTISPFIILIFLAALSLLLIEDIFSKSRHKLNAE